MDIGSAELRIAVAANDFEVEAVDCEGARDYSAAIAMKFAIRANNR